MQISSQIKRSQLDLKNKTREKEEREKYLANIT